MTVPWPHDHAATLARLSREISGAETDRTTAARICEVATAHVPGCDDASITLRVRRGRLATVGASSGTGAALDDAQYTLGEGPCVDAAREGRPVWSNSIRGDHSRWPAWSAEAARQGRGSVFSIPLVDGEDAVMGAVNCYSRNEGVWDVEAREFAVVYATHAALALDSARVITGLRTAMTTRHEIGVAQGILMERHGLGLDQAFNVLRRYAEESDTKLHAVAAEVVRTHAGAVPRRAPEGEPPG